MIKFEEYDYYIKPGCTDLRKGALKLSLIVQDEMELNPFTKSIFMFCSKNRKTIYLRQLSLIDFYKKQHRYRYREHTHSERLRICHNLYGYCHCSGK